MTARWFSASRKMKGGNATSPRRPSKSETGGFTHGTGQAVSKGGSQSRVLVAQNVGCRSGYRGTLTVRPRKAERPHEGATSSDGEGNWPGTGLVVIRPAEGC